MNEMHENSVAVITGGASGIGLAIARKFVKNGIKTVLIGRDRVKLKEACSAMGKLADWKVCDLTDLDRDTSCCSDNC